MDEITRRKLFIGYFLAMPETTAGCTVGQCLIDTQDMDREALMDVLNCDGHDIDTWIAEGERFV